MVEVFSGVGAASIANNAHGKANQVGVPRIGGVIPDPGQSLAREVIGGARNLLQSSYFLVGLGSVGSDDKWRIGLLGACSDSIREQMRQAFFR
jgi:hypothetical protein